MNSLHYQPSGRVPAAAIPIVLVYALATLPAAWLYAWLTAHVPPIVTAFFVIVYAVVLGCVASMAAAHGKIRNPAWMGYLGLVIGFAGWYFQMAAWVAAKIHMLAQNPDAYRAGAGFFALLAHPGALFDTLAGIARVGTWGFGDKHVTGWTLAAFWLVEALLFLSFPCLLGRSRARDPFDETANAWAEKVDVPRKFAHIDDPQAVPAMLAQHPGDLLRVLAPWQEHVSLSYATVTIHRCRGEDSYVSINNVAARMGKNKVEESTTGVVQFMRLPGVDPDALMRELMEATPAPEDDDGDGEQAPVPRELETALGHLQAGRDESVIVTASPYIDADDIALRTDATRLCAIASSKLARWETARGYWEALFADEPTAHNAVQVATTSVMAGNVEQGKSWLERAAAINETSREMPGIAMETNFMSALTNSGNAQAALPYLDRLKSVYVALTITDPTFLALRHVPRFDMFLENSAPILDASMPAEQKREWYAAMLPHLDDEGKAMLTAWMDKNVQVQSG